MEESPRLMTAFVLALRGEGAALRTSARDSLESHLMAFAAFASLLDDRSVRAT